MSSARRTVLWQRCGAHVLRREVGILTPRHVVVVGSGHKHRALCDHVLRGSVEWRREDSVRLGKRNARLVHARIASELGLVGCWSCIRRRPAVRRGRWSTLLVRCWPSPRDRGLRRVHAAHRAHGVPTA